MIGIYGESAHNAEPRLPATSSALGADPEAQLQQLLGENEKLQPSLEDKDQHIQNLKTKLKDAPNTKANTPVDIQPYFQQNAQEYIEENVQECTQQDVEPYFSQNTQEYFPQNTQECFEGDVQKFMQENGGHYFPQNTQGDFTQNTQEYFPQDTQEYFPQNNQEILKSTTLKTLKSTSLRILKSTTLKTLKKYFPQDTQEYFPQNTQEYFPQDTQEYFPQNNQECFTQNNQECFPQNTQDDFAQNTQEYFPQNTQEYFTQNTQEYVPQNAQQYIEDVQESTLDNFELYIPQNTQDSQQNIQSQMANSFNHPEDLVTHPVAPGSLPNSVFGNHNNLSHSGSGLTHSFTEPNPYHQYAGAQSFSPYDVQQSTPEMMSVTDSGYASVSPNTLPSQDESDVLGIDPTTTHMDQEEHAEESPRLPCDLCGSTYPNRESLRRHRLRVHKVSTGRNVRKQGEYGCDICGKSYWTADLRRIHRQRIHDPTSAHRKKCKTVNGGITCPQCPDGPNKKKYTSRKMLENHKSIVHGRG
ncbi:hypothetical protein M434DRAFT_373397 [Hypoxylon sp. CO27-5]|nr:hypothetical protein M434DRAFT_373397 [Hypoxylon sp. CO27-5]